MSPEALWLRRTVAWLEWQDDQPWNFGMTRDKLVEAMRHRLRVRAQSIIGAGCEVQR